MKIDQFRSDVDALPDDPANFEEWYGLWKDIYNKNITLETKNIDTKNEDLKTFEGVHLICPAEDTRLKKQKARRAHHNWAINVQKHIDTKVNRPEFSSLKPYGKKVR
eukprot:UN34895